MNNGELTLVQQISEASDYSIFTSSEIVEVLSNCSDAYYNSGNSPLSDEKFDSLERYLYLSDKTNPYFIGVGSSVRGEKVKLPYSMGSLDQVDIGNIERWVKDNKLENEDIVISDKMDGVSCLAIYDDNGDLQIAYSRGDGLNGQDITRHVAQIPSVPKKVSGKMVVRGEIEMSETDFKNSQKVIKSRTGDVYRNARNAMAGMMNAESNDKKAYPFMTFIAYQVLEADSSIIDVSKDTKEFINDGFETKGEIVYNSGGNIVYGKCRQFEFLLENGFIRANCFVFKGKELNDHMLSEHIKARKKELDFAIDGIVLDVDCAKKRAAMNPTRDTLNPKYSIKYKITDDTNLAIATVIGVEWNVSKHGYLKPRVNIEPVELVGVTVQYATGFNAKFISDNKIGPGAKITITRSGDVIPYIIGVTYPAKEPQLPEVPCHWNDSGVDLILDNHHNNEDVMIQQTISFFTAIDAPLLKEGNVRYLFETQHYESSTDAIFQMLHYDRSEWEDMVGENGIKIYDGLIKKCKELPLYDLMGASPFFGVGLGSRKFKKLVSSLRITNIDKISSLTKYEIISVDGFEEVTAEKVLAGIPSFIEFFKTLPKYVKVQYFKESENKSMEGQAVVFTGFRDPELHKMVERFGGEMKTSVSSKTTILVTAEPDSTSGKAKKARELGVKVIGVDELREMLGIEVQAIVKVGKSKKKDDVDDLLEF